MAFTAIRASTVEGVTTIALARLDPFFIQSVNRPRNWSQFTNTSQRVGLANASTPRSWVATVNAPILRPMSFPTSVEKR